MRQIDAWFDLTSVDEGRKVVVLGCPWDGSGSGRRGAAGGPTEIRRWARSQQAIDERGRPVEGLRVLDRGDIAGGHRAIESAARAALAAHPDARLMAIGGDHSITQPLVRAAIDRHPGLGLVTLDAHADLFDRYEEDPASHACTVARAWDAGVDPERTALVGLRSWAYPERPALDRAGLVVSSRDWLAAGAEDLAARIGERMAGGPVYLSIDIDVLDPAHAPGTGYPVAGGPSSRALLDLLAELWPRLDVVAFDLVEVSPALDPADTTAACAAHVLLQCLSHVARRDDPSG